MNKIPTYTNTNTYTKMLLYHGTSQENALSIISEQKFDLNLCGKQWGSTYGRGIYFSPSKEEAQVYGETILEIQTQIKPLKLEKHYSPNDKSHKRQIKKIINTLGPDAFETCDNKEIVIFNTSKIENIRIV